MSLVVLDCSVVVPWFYPEENDTYSRMIWSLARQRSLTCISPDLLTWEFGNVALKKCRCGFGTKQETRTILGGFLALPIKTYEARFMALDSWDLAQQHGLTAYDGAYLALAKRSSCQLATSDTKLRAAARDEGLFFEI